MEQKTISSRKETVCFNLMKEQYKDEVWKTIDEFPRYMISNYGRVKSFIGVEKILSQYTIGGYLVVKLSSTPTAQGIYKQKNIKVHRLVAQYFCEGFFGDKQVHHIDRDRTNNYYKNLLCVTKAEHAAIHKQLNSEDNKKAAANNAAAFICKGESK